MIRYFENGDLFSSNADALVNTVNCKGVMGKGIALQFKKKFPECFVLYKETCNNCNLNPGKLMYIRNEILPADMIAKRPGIILFPTKIHWKDKSKLEWIDIGLYFLKQHYKVWKLTSVAMPQLGCGLGGLNWNDVKSLISNYFSQEDLLVEVYYSTPTSSCATL